MLKQVVSLCIIALLGCLTLCGAEGVEADISLKVLDNTSDCPSNYTYLTLQECQDVVLLRLIGVTSFGSAGNWQTLYPKGCWKQGSHLNYNTGQGGPDEIRDLVCKLEGGNITVAGRSMTSVQETNNNTCPSGFTYFASKQQCKDLANGGLVAGVSRFSMSGYCGATCPNGCYTRGSTAFFNNADSGGPDIYRSLVCIQEKLAAAVDTDESVVPVLPSGEAEVRPFSINCSRGYRYMTEQECRDLVTAGTLESVDGFGHAGMWGTLYPKGCWKQDRHLNYNTGPGGPDAHRDLICRKMAVPIDTPTDSGIDGRPGDPLELPHIMESPEKVAVPIDTPTDTSGIDGRPGGASGSVGVRMRWAMIAQVFFKLIFATT